MKFRKKRTEIIKTWDDFTEKYRAEKSYRGTWLTGIFLEDVPEGWSQIKGAPTGVCKPLRRKVCMEAYKEFKALKPDLTGHELERMLKTGAPCDGRKMYLPTFEKIGRDLILNLHKEHKVPDGVIKLKTSEYWELRELAEAS